MTIGFMILANGATIITVFTTAMQLSKQFGVLQTNVEINSKTIEKQEKRIYRLETGS